MKTLYIIIFFIVGCIFGSFYNVVAYRLSNNKSLIRPGSNCDNCHHKLGVFDLIPLLSYIFLKGKCRYCHHNIGAISFFAELFTGILFTVSFYSFSFSYDLLISLCLSSLFIIVMITDLTYYIIPDQVTITFGIIIFIINLFKYQADALYYLLFGFFMFLFMYLLMLIGNKIFKQESIGGGDIKLLFVLGMSLPLVLSFISLALSCILALPISFYFYFNKKDKIIPFGPFLVSAFLIVFMLKIDIAEIYDLLLIR